MICCINCFCDPEVCAAIEIIGHQGDCPICKRKDTWIYDSDIDAEQSYLEELLEAILEIYLPESELSNMCPESNRSPIEEHLLKDWNIFSGTQEQVKQIVEGLLANSLNLSEKILCERVGIPQLYDETYLISNCIMGQHSWSDFKAYLRNENRFHNKYINLEILGEILKETEVVLPKGDKYYRARVSNERGRKGFLRREMGPPPYDVATPGRANSKGQSCLYLSNQKKLTLKEIRAHAFDYVTIATFRLKRDLRVLDLGSISHNSPFYARTDKIAYLINEKLLKEMESDLAKPMSRWDSDLDYLPTQYISDFARFLGYDGVKYLSTFDKEAYNLALFDSSSCDCIYHGVFLVGNLEYKIMRV